MALVVVGAGCNSCSSDASGPVVWQQRFEAASACGSQLTSVAGAPDGSAVVAGQLRCRVDLDPGPEVAQHYSGSFDAVVASFGSEGELRWAKTFGGVGNEEVADVGVGPAGEVVVTGTFSNAVDFDPGDGVVERRGFDDIFVLQLDGAGYFQWVRVLGGPGKQSPRALAVDRRGVVTVVGAFEGTVDFDPGPGVDRRRANEEPDLTHGGDAFVAAFSDDGQLRWTRTFGGPGQDAATDVAMTPGGDAVVLGSFRDAVDFGQSPERVERTARAESGEVSGMPNLFVIRLSESGETRWVTTRGWGPRSITLGPDDAVYLTYTSWVGVELSRLSGVGEPLWSRRIGTEEQIRSETLLVSPRGELVLSGVFSGAVDFDLGPAEVRRQSASRSLFVATYGLSGGHRGLSTWPVDRAVWPQDTALALDGELTVVGLSSGSLVVARVAP